MDSTPTSNELKLAQALHDYGKHRPYCWSRSTNPAYPDPVWDCTCRFLEALAISVKLVPLKERTTP